MSDNHSSITRALDVTKPQKILSEVYSCVWAPEMFLSSFNNNMIIMTSWFSVACATAHARGQEETLNRHISEGCFRRRVRYEHGK